MNDAVKVVSLSLRLKDLLGPVTTVKKKKKKKQVASADALDDALAMML